MNCLKMARGGASARALVAGAALTMMFAGQAPAQKVEFKTMELRTIHEPQDPVFVQAAARRRAGARRHGYVVRKRSKKKSAAIVGGTAATGAALGALAGGGKGAAIGAIAGGGAGFVYDRHTNKKRVRAQ